MLFCCLLILCHALPILVISTKKINTNNNPNNNQPWDCPMCTFANGPLSSICGICGNRKPAEKENETWSCSKCTFINDKNSKQCSICHQPKLV